MRSYGASRLGYQRAAASGTVREWSLGWTSRFKWSDTLPIPDAGQRTREAVRDTVKRGACGNVLLPHSRFVTAQDKSLDNIAV